MDENSIMLTGWQYRLDDSVSDSASWKNLTNLKDIERTESSIVWFSTELPEFRERHPALYFKRVNNPMMVYINGRLIQKVGAGVSEKNDAFFRWDDLLISLPDYNKGDIISVKIFPGKKLTGFKWNVLIVSFDKICKEFFVRNIDDFSFAVIFLITGIIILLFYVTYDQSALLIGIGVFLLSLAVFISSNNPFLHILLPFPNLYYHLDYISLMCAVISAFFAIEQILGQEYRKILKSIWLFHFFVLLISIVLINFTTITFPDIVNYFLISLTLNMIICIFVMVKSVKTGEYTAKLLFAGMSVFLMFAILEITLFYSKFSDSAFSYSVTVLHFGALFFVISLIWIAVYHYTYTYRQKELAQQKELEAVKRGSKIKEQFTMKLIESQESERNRIALELHDSIGQKLLIIKNMLLTEIRKSTDKNIQHSLTQVSDLSGETIQDVRNIIYNLRPQHLDQLGLTTAIETIVENLSETSDINFYYEIDDIDELIPKHDEINFYRIIQESLNNIVRHSKATEASVFIKKSDQIISMEIRDNGVGISRDITTGNIKSSGLGLVGMYERARMINADLNIEPYNEGGTFIKLDYKLKKNIENE